MNCHQYEAALSEYVGRRRCRRPMSRATRAARRARGAPRRRARGAAAIVEDLHTLRDAARTLEPHVPPAHVWTRIAARSSAAAAAPGGRSFRRPCAGSRSPPPQLLVARARRIVDRLAPGHRAGACRHVPRVRRGQPPDPALVQDVETELRLAEEHYVRAIAGLETIAKSRRLGAGSADGGSAAGEPDRDRRGDRREPRRAADGAGERRGAGTACSKRCAAR